MKTRILLCLVFFAYAWVGQAQEGYYVSKNFEKKGVIEYIQFAPDNQVHYWTNLNRKRIALVHVSSGTSQTGEYVNVRFPNSQKVYTLQMMGQTNYMTCYHPDKRKQSFVMELPTYLSRGFEQKGVIEYLQRQGDDWVYWTSANTKRIKLKVQWSGLNQFGDMSYKVAFPSSKQTYMLSISGRGRKAKVTCIHPNGKHQEFSTYYQD